VPRDEKPRRGNNNDDDDDDDEDAAVLIASILSIFFFVWQLQQFCTRCSFTLYMTKKKKNKKGLYFWISFALQTS
jgi:hypothetical protein